MRVDAVQTNVTCNQNCTYCVARRPAEDPAFVRKSAVIARIDAAVRGGARAIVLTGGEPTLRRDLAELVAHARGAGAERVVLETNATLVDAARARALRDAGLSLARVNLAGAGDWLDEVTRDPGGFARTRAGLDALAAAEVPVEIAVAVVRATIARLTELPAAVAGKVAGILVHVPDTSPDPAELVSYEEAARAIAALDGACRRHGVALKLAPDAGPPPCVFEGRARVAHLFSLTRGSRASAEGRRHLDACERCQVRDRCPGISGAYLARHGAPPMEPIDDDRLRRRLSLVSTVEDQIRREMVTANLAHGKDGAIEERVVRIHFHCNQACRFCFVSTHLPAPPEEDVRAAIVSAVRAGVRVVLSGGEPTLNPRLAEYVALAADGARHGVQLQTNAVLLDDPARVAALVDAGLTGVFVALHASDAATSDRITDAPGTFVRTLAGLDLLARAPVDLMINFVLCHANRGHLVPVVRLVAERWPGAQLTLSFVAASTDVVPRDRDLIPRYAEALPEIAAAVAEASRLGVRLRGFEAMCGVPLCLVPKELDGFFANEANPEGFDGGEFVRAEACRGCALADRCFGLRRGYAELYGDGELVRITR